MNTALKSKVTSGADEFELPDTLSPVVEDLKKEQQTIKNEIDEVKARPVVRKQDESTRVFNLRQHQMELKLQELEEKKKTSEKELQDILQQKNSTLHTDLRKLAQILLNETKKVSAKVDSVSNIRNELQTIFEANLSDRKKTLALVEDQNKAIEETGNVIRETLKALQGEFHFLTKDIERLNSEKEEVVRKLAALKQEVAHNQGLSSEIEDRKKHLREVEEEISSAEKNALAFARLDEELLRLRDELSRNRSEKETTDKEIRRIQESHFQAQENLAGLRHQEAELDHQVNAKKKLIATLESDILDARKRTEATRSLEHELQTKLTHMNSQLSSLQNDVSALQAEKTTHLLMADESKSLFEERKIFYKRELELIEEANASRKAELEAQQEMRKGLWEAEFESYCESRRNDLKLELDAIDRKDLEDIRNKKKHLLEEISKTMTTILSAEGFQSSEEKSRKARKEVETTFELMFGKTRRWKFW